MGNTISDQFTTLGERVTKLSNDVSKRFGTFATGPSHPLTMPTLGDGRSQDQLRTQAEVMYNIDTKTCLNIAFIGPNNEAKIALINSMRFVQDCRPDQGIISPNSTATQYVHCDPMFHHLRFWDLTDFTSGTFIDRCLYAFDVLVIVVTEVLRSNDIQLIKDACKVNPPPPVFIVRSEMNQYIDKFLGLEASSTDIVKSKCDQGPVLKEGIRNQLSKGEVHCPVTCDNIYLLSPPGMLAARAVNFDGTKYIWDEFDFLKGLLEQVSKRRY